MKIDFHTYYSDTDFTSLCKKARKLSLDALVMVGLPDNHDRQYKGLLLFPAQEVEWVAALEDSGYLSVKDYYNDIKRGSTQAKMYRGKALLLLPSSIPFLEEYEEALFDLMQNVSGLGGVTVSLQDDTNWPITYSIENCKHVYPFDATRIRPFNSHDIHSELPFAVVSVAGSAAYSANDLTEGKGFTVYDKDMRTKAELIMAIKNTLPNRLFIHGNKENPPVPIESTVKPLRPNLEKFWKRIGWE